MSGPSRIVPIEDLPDSLWSNSTLYIAPQLLAAYCESVRVHHLEALATSPDQRDSPVGGDTDAAADKHFAQAFDGSVARTELALLDPKGEVSHIADALTKLFAGGRIAILDIPSGAGAFSLAILSTLAELRAREILPRQPLEVVIVGGEYNPRASEYADDLHNKLQQSFLEQGIQVEHKALFWNVCDQVSTTALLQRYIADSGNVDRKLVVVSNFSGFLVKSSKQKDAEPQLEEIFRFCSGSNSTALWIEPQTKAATSNLFTWIFTAIKKSIWRFLRLVPSDSERKESPVQTEAKFELPLKSGKIATARLSILRFDLRAPLA